VTSQAFTEALFYLGRALDVSELSMISPLSPKLTANVSRACRTVHAAGVQRLHAMMMSPAPRENRYLRSRLHVEASAAHIKHRERNKLAARRGASVKSVESDV
jgi:hypothetical protein